MNTGITRKDLRVLGVLAILVAVLLGIAWLLDWNQRFGGFRLGPPTMRK